MMGIIRSGLLALTLLSTGCSPEQGAEPTPPAPAPTVEPTSAAAEFSSEASALTATQKTTMTDSSWRIGCPVPVEDLRHLEVSYWDMDGHARTGQIIVHADAVEATTSAFQQIFAARYPITKMRLIDEYDGDDDASMLDDNTSAFNCRTVKDSASWSRHAYGRAIDINPFENPWVRGNTVDPPQAAEFADRSRDDARLIRRGDAVWKAFADVGWEWGGDWTASKDYQHFEAARR